MALANLCKHIGCLKRAKPDGYCSNPNHKAVKHRSDDKYNLFYHTPSWRKLRAMKIENNPTCEDCDKEGVARLADVVDHIIEIKDNWDLRLDYDNLKSRCHKHHNAKTAQRRHDRRIDPSELSNR